MLTKLAAPLDPNRVKHREGSGGRSLSYLEGHDVIRTANEVFGIGGWGYVVNDLTCIGTEPFERKDFKTGETKKGIRVGYRALVMARIGEVSFEEVGYGDAQEYNGSTITPHELASKEAVTDALKRALKNLGDQFGLVLYDKFAPEHNGRNATAPGTGASSSAGSVGARGGQAAVTEPHSPASPAATNFASPGSLAWKYGPHAGVTIADTPLDYVIEYAESGTNGFMAGKCKAYLEESGSAVEDPDSSIPF